MLEWIHQLLDVEFMVLTKMAKSLYMLQIDGIKYIIKRTRSGPAHTLNVEVVDPYIKTKSFSMDLVVAITMDARHWKSDIPFEEKNWANKWHAIPKPDHVGVQEGDCEWITSYADIERLFMKDRYKLKVIIRIFKVSKQLMNFSFILL